MNIEAKRQDVIRAAEAGAAVFTGPGMFAKSTALGEFDLALATFGPPETEAIADIPQPLQRLWRHRGHIPSGPRYAHFKFTSLEVAELCVRYRLSGCSVPPAQSGDLGKSAGRVALLAALRHGDHALELIGTTREAGDAIRQLSHDPAIAAAICGIDCMDARRYLWSADGSDFAFAGANEVQRLASRSELFLLIDLVAMGRRIAERAKRPLATLTYRSRNGGPVPLDKLR
jgi:hypothetical protein